MARLLVLAPLLLLAVPGGARSEVDATLRTRLEALGYVDEVEHDRAPEKRGVTVHEASRASEGINVYCSAGRKTAHFLRNDGNEVRRITLELPGAGPDCMVAPYGPGRVIGLRSPSIALVTLDSRIEWKSDELHHHDAAIAPNGDVFTFMQLPSFWGYEGSELPFIDQAIVQFDPKGTEKRRIGFEGLFADRVDPTRLERMHQSFRAGETADRPYELLSDLYHPNTIEWLERPVAGAERGDLLVAIRELDLIAIVDADEERIVWDWGPGELDRPHHPQLLPNGNILIFDNGYHRGWSRLVELDPVQKRIVWTYDGTPARSLGSAMKGSVQLLANGNLLVTESTKGRVFEITREGQVVWEFWNPNFSAEGRRLHIYRMFRLTPQEYATFASGSTAPVAEPAER